MRAMLIVNPHATSTTDRRRDLLAHALASELRLAVEHTSGRGHATELAAKATESGAELIVVHGGDGTVNEAVNGILQVRPPVGSSAGRPMLAVVPGGSTNVFARAMGVDADPTAAAEQILAALDGVGRGRSNAIRSFSVGQADDRYFTFNAGLGLDAEVVEAVEKVRADGKQISNSLHVRKTVRRYLSARREPARLTVTIPGREPVSGVHLVFVSNLDPWTYWESRPVRTNPTTGPATGLGVFALTSLRLISTLRVAAQLVRDGSGPSSSALLRADNVPELLVECATPVGLQVDGDYLGPRDRVQFRSVPDALRLLGPELPADPGQAPSSAFEQPSALSVVGQAPGQPPETGTRPEIGARPEPPGPTGEPRRRRLPRPRLPGPFRRIHRRAADVPEPDGDTCPTKNDHSE